MAKAPRDEDLTRDAERRAPTPRGRKEMAGVQVRDDDIEPATGLASVAILFRVLAVVLLVLMVLQVMNGLSGTVEISYGVLIAEAIRLLIFAGLLWGAGGLADLFVKSHYDLRAARILLGRINHIVGQTEFADSHPDDGAPRRGGGATH